MEGRQLLGAFLSVLVVTGSFVGVVDPAAAGQVDGSIGSVTVSGMTDEDGDGRYSKITVTIRNADTDESEKTGFLDQAGGKIDTYFKIYVGGTLVETTGEVDAIGDSEDYSYTIPVDVSSASGTVEVEMWDADDSFDEPTDWADDLMDTATAGSISVESSDRDVVEYDLTVHDSSNGGFSLDPPGASFPTTTTRAYPEGTEVTITAEPADGYTFDRWSGDVPPHLQEDRSITLTVDRALSVTPHFERGSGELTVDVRHQNGNRAKEVNGIVVWQDRVGGDPHEKIVNYPGVDLPVTLSDLPAGHEYKVNLYVNDQFAGSSGWISIGAGDSKSVTETVSDPVRLKVRTVARGTNLPVEGVMVRVESHEGVVWRCGVTGQDGYTTTGCNGETISDGWLWLHPTNAGSYTITASLDGETLVERDLTDLSGDREERIEVPTTVADVDGEISGYENPTEGAEYELDRWYDVTLRVRNTGEITKTFEVRAIEASGREVENPTKSVTLEPGETGTVTFRQRWYGVYTQTRQFDHELFVSTGDGREKVDESSVTLQRPPAGDLTVRFTDGEGNQLDARFELRNADGDLIRDGFGAAIYRNLPAGEYELTARGPGHVTRSVEFTLRKGEDKTVELSLPSENVDAELVDGSFEVVERKSRYGAGEVVSATVRVRNTGNADHRFFVGYSARDEYGNFYDNDGGTGQFVGLEPGETRTVTLEWTVPAHAFNGTYDLVTAVWFDYPEAGQEPLERSGWLREAVEVRQQGGREVSDSLTDAVERYRTEQEPTVGVLPEMTVDGRDYRMVVYMGSQTPFDWTGVRQDSSVFQAFHDRPPGDSGQQSGWEQFDVRKVVVFQNTDDGYQVVVDSSTVREVARLAAPGSRPFRPSWLREHPDRSDFLAEPDYNDDLVPDEARVQEINEVVNDWVKRTVGQPQTWIETESDHYFVAVSSMTSLRTESLISTALREHLTTANSLADAIERTTALLEAVDGVDERVVEKYLDLLEDYRVEVETVDVNKLNRFNSRASQIGHALDFLLSMAEYQVYSEDRIENLQTVLAYAEANEDVELDPALRSAIERVVSEHGELSEQLVHNFVNFLVEKAVEESGEWAMKRAGSLAVVVFAQFLVAVGAIASSTGAILASAAASIATLALTAVEAIDVLFNVSGTYGVATKARYSYLAAEEFDAVADDIRADNYGQGLTARVVGQYRAADAMKIHALGTYWKADSAVLASEWSDEARVEVYDAFDVSNNLDTRRGFYIDRGREARAYAEWLYSPETINKTVDSIPDEVVSERPAVDVETDVNVGEIADGATQELKLENVGGAELRIDSVVAPDGISASAGATTVAPDESTTLALTFDGSTLGGSFSETVFVHTNSPASPVRINVRGELVSTTDENRPRIDDFEVRNPEGSRLKVTFVSNESLTAVEVRVTDGEGDVTTLTAGDLAEELRNGDWTYAATLDVGSAGMYTATLATAEDAAGNDGATGQSTSVTIDDNDPPTARLSANETKIEAGDSVLLDASDSSDSDDSPNDLSYEWTLRSGSDSANPDLAEEATNTVTLSSAGTFEFEVTVSDGNAADTDTVTITVERTEGTSASLEAADVTAEPGANATIDFSLTNTGTATTAYILNLSGRPDGFVVVDQSAAGGTWKASETKWLLRTVDTGMSVEPSVTLAVPDDADGTYTVEATALTGAGRVESTTVNVSTAVSVEKAVDGNDDGEIDGVEVLQAIEYWRNDAAVPDTGGKTIDDIEVLKLIEAWRNDVEVDEG